MKLISHRGNVHGKNESFENSPEYIDQALRSGYEVEIDVRVIDNIIWLGHDEAQYQIDERWLSDRLSSIWIHCKNIEAMEYFDNTTLKYNYFWHEEDTLTLTSKNYLWVYPGKQPIKNSIAVMPELNDDDISECIGICSDYIEKYDKNINSLRN